MRFFSELNGKEFTYGDFNSSNYGLIFANYKSDFETKMGGSYETKTFIPMHGLRFGVLQQKYKDPYSGEFEIVKESGVLSDTEAETVYKTLFMDEGRSYRKLRYISPCELSFDFVLRVDHSMTFNSNTDYIVLYQFSRLSLDYLPAEAEVTFDVTGSANNLELFIQRKTGKTENTGNVGLRLKQNATSIGSETVGSVIRATGSYRAKNRLGYINIGNSALQTSSTNNYTTMLDGSYLTSLSPQYVKCMLSDASIIEGGYGIGTTDANGSRISTHAGWGTVGFKFTLTADSQYCWTDVAAQARVASATTFKSGLITTLPVIQLTMLNATTEYSGSNTISFSFGGKTTSITLPNAVRDTAASGAALYFVIDSKQRRVYALDHANNLITTVVSHTETNPDTGVVTETKSPIANYFNGVFPAFAKASTTTIGNLTPNIATVTLGEYSIGDLL